MRKIKIYQRGASDIEILDDSDVEFDQYCKDLAKIFHMSNVVILKTSTSTFIGRPSQVSGVVVEDLDLNDQREIESENAKPQVEEKPQEIQEDIITDMD